MATYSPPVTAGNENVFGFGAVGGNITNQQVVSQFDIYDRYEWMHLLARHGMRPGFVNVIDALGFSRGVANPSVGHYELGWFENLVTVGAIDTAAGGAGNDMIIELDASNMYATPGVEISAAQQYSAFVNERNEILLPGGTLAVVREVDRTVNPFLVTIYPKDVTIDLDDVVNADESYAVISSNFHEGSGIPASRTPRFIHYSNTFQIDKETWSITGSEATNKMYFSVQQVEGSILIVAERETLKHWMQKKSNIILFGQQATSAPILNTNLGFDTPDTGTEGYLAFTETYGHPLTYTPGSFNITDFDAMSALFELEMLPYRDFLFGSGIKLHQEVTNELYNNNIASNADYVYTMMGGNTVLAGDPFQFASAEDYSISIGFKSFHKDGYSYHFRTFHEFNAAMVAGGDVYDYNQRAYVSPLGEKMSREGVKRATIGYEWKQLGNLSRKDNLSMIYGAGTTSSGIVQSPNDIMQCVVLTEMAGHFTCANQCLWFAPV